MNPGPAARTGPYERANPAQRGVAGAASDSANVSATGSDLAAAWTDALDAAAVFAVDPHGIGGVRLRGVHPALRPVWFDRLREWLTAPAPLLRVPCQVPAARLLGGLDLAATLQAGRPVAERGLLAAADGGVLVLQMAERLPAASAALIAAALDDGAVQLERDGFSLRAPARLGVVACDEGIAADELPPAALLDRLACWVDLQHVSWRVAQDADLATALPDAAQLEAARARLATVMVPEEVGRALCTACLALGIDSLRVPLLALRVARAAAALDGAASVAHEHAALAARLVIAPRARSVPPDDAPAPEETAAQTPPQDAPPQARDAEDPAQTEPDPDGADEDGAPPDTPFGDVVLEAARAALPQDLLERIARGAAPRHAGAAGGRTGVQQRSKLRGRPVGTQRGDPRGGVRLHVLETLRAAAPWQRLRRRDRPDPHGGATAPGRRVEVRREDFRVVRYSQRSQTTVIFVVDASGSAALRRLGEAKGAVELFLADCYVRRDQVALITFRGRGAELLLPPTRSLARARRCLAAVPGGGGTPVAAGLRSAAALADAARRRGELALVVLLTDGKANIGLDGKPGRAQAGADALAMAHLLRRGGVRSLLIDFSPRPQIEAQDLAREMGAQYLPLPYAGAAGVADAVRTVRLAVE
jgi:magnesium chelatase subunit D